MFKKGSRALIVILALGALIFFAVTAFFAGLANDQDVVVAKVPLAAGTRLRADLVEVRQLNASAVLPGAFKSIEDIEGLVLGAARMPGDQITESIVGTKALSAVASALGPERAAVAVRVDQATGLAGIVRVGDTVGAVGIVTAQDLGLPDESQSIQLPTSSFSSPILQPTLGVTATRTPTPTPTPRAVGAQARVVLRDLKVLVVPQTFRYEEAAPGEKGDEFTTARTTQQQQSSSVIVLDAPLAPIEVVPGISMSPVELLALLNEKGKLHFYLQPATPGTTKPQTRGIGAKELFEKVFGPGTGSGTK